MTEPSPITRKIPLVVQIKLFFNNWIIAGLICLLISIIILFILDDTLYEAIYFDESVRTANGSVVSSWVTDATINDVDVCATEYTFKNDGGVEYEGISYGSTGLGKHTKVRVEYVYENPWISRIEGMKMGHFGESALWILIIPFVISLVLLLIGFRKIYIARKLLISGKLCKGKLESKEATNTAVNEKTVYKLTFKFDTDQGPTKLVVKTHNVENLLDEEEEFIFYDPSNPDRAYLADTLPGSPKVDENGAFYYDSLEIKFLARPLILGLVVGAAVLYFLLEDRIF